MKPQRSPIYTYTVDVCAVNPEGFGNKWAFELRVWRHTDTWQGRLPPQVLSQMGFVGTQDDVRDAAQAFLDLVKIKDETL